MYSYLVYNYRMHLNIPSPSEIRKTAQRLTHKVKAILQSKRKIIKKTHQHSPKS